LSPPLGGGHGGRTADVVGGVDPAQGQPVQGCDVSNFEPPGHGDGSFGNATMGTLDHHEWWASSSGGGWGMFFWLGGGLYLVR
jgi:hypothetical protein